MRQQYTVVTQQQMVVRQFLLLKYSINHSRIEQSIELAGLFLLHETSVKNYSEDEGVWKELCCIAWKRETIREPFPTWSEKLKQRWRR
jgi:hypothetical protein